MARYFWATAPGTEARKAEERLVAERGLKLTECKGIEALAHGSLAGGQTAAPHESLAAEALKRIVSANEAEKEERAKRVEKLRLRWRRQSPPR